MSLNPDTKTVEAIQKRLKEVTDGHCPCVPETLWDEDVKCPCKKYRKEKVCCCGLFI